MGGNASGTELGNGRPRHESVGASFVLHAAQMPGGLRLVCVGLGPSPEEQEAMAKRMLH